MSAEGARCPIGGERIDESAARVNATIVVAVVITALVTQKPWILGYLVVDYLIKLTFGFAYSPNCIIARTVANMLGLERRLVDSAPKRFAAVLACFMSVLALVMAYSFHSLFWFNVVALMFVGVASMDAFAEFCLGCYLFGLLPERISAVMVRR
jgi:hypothetical protein